jgi:hypothetical protein
LIPLALGISRRFVLWLYITGWTRDRTFSLLQNI